VGQVAQVILEGGKARGRLAVDLEAGQAIGEPLLGVGDHGGPIDELARAVHDQRHKLAPVTGFLRDPQVQDVNGCD
jgi:hypothetical protein